MKTSSTGSSSWWTSLVHHKADDGPELTANEADEEHQKALQDIGIMIWKGDGSAKDGILRVVHPLTKVCLQDGHDSIQGWLNLPRGGWTWSEGHLVCVLGRNEWVQGFKYEDRNQKIQTPNKSK